jgi:hypothetical protein
LNLLVSDCTHVVDTAVNPRLVAFRAKEVVASFLGLICLWRLPIFKQQRFVSRASLVNSDLKVLKENFGSVMKRRRQKLVGGHHTGGGNNYKSCGWVLSKLLLIIQA